MNKLKKFYIFLYRCRRLPKALKEWQAFLDLKKKIDDFSESCPLLELMSNKAMKERHWDRIATVTGHTFDFDSENFTLRDIMKAPLLKHKEDIEVIYIIKPCYFEKCRRAKNCVLHQIKNYIFFTISSLSQKY